MFFLWSTQLRPPQPAVYLFVLDVSHNAVETGYLNVFCQSLLDNINSYVHYTSCYYICERALFVVFCCALKIK